MKKSWVIVQHFPILSPNKNLQMQKMQYIKEVQSQFQIPHFSPSKVKVIEI